MSERGFRPPRPSHLNQKNTMKKSILVIALAAFTPSCGESDSERAQRISEELDRQTLLEYQRQENIQRQRDRDQQAVDSILHGLDIITR